MDWFLHFVGAFIGGGATALILLFGFSRWLGSLWLGRLLENEKAKYAEEMEKLKAGFAQDLEHYRAELDRSIFVTHVHFETEYTAMKEVLQRLAEVKVIWLKLHPKVGGRKDVDHDEGIELLRKATEKFQEKLEEWAAFLEPTIYDQFENCFGGADEEWRRLKAGNDEADRAGTAHHFWTAYRHACQRVRDRIKTLAVVPRT